MHTTGEATAPYRTAAYFFYVSSTLLTYVLPVVLLFIPWWALLVQVRN